MIKNILAAGAIAAASLSFVAIAHAGDIPATPINHGPMTLRGLGLVGDVGNVGLTPVNIVTQPILAPGAVAGEPAGEAPVAKHRHHRHRKH